ncbi:TPA: restriction endonuclease subunit S [Kluyvera ascorbata]|nr:restriction endonuclease subunit S [Kluyvera ascorbata]
MGSKIKLGELLSTLTDYHANGAYKKLKENVELLDEPDFAVMIRTTNFEQEDFSNNVKYISKHAYEFLAKSKVYPNDIIMNKIANAGSSYLMPDLKTPVSLAMNLFLLRIDDTKANPIYIYIYLKINEAYVKSFANGSVTKTITKDAVKNLEIELPNRAIQDQVVAQFTCINDKIILNRQINQTLEQMSQTLFKSWFVDFDPVIDNALDAGNPIPEALQSRTELRQKVRNSADFKPLPADIRALFPAEFEETELGWVPKGWITTSFNDLIELIGGGTPKTSVEEYWNGDIPWFSVVDAPNESDVYVLTTEKNITTEGLNNSSAKLLRKGTTIISARGTVGKCAMVAVPMAMNQSCYGVIGKNNISDEYVYFQLKNAVQTLQQMGHGSVFNTITRDTFKNIKVPFCNEELTNSYSLLVKNYFSKILNNNYQNIALTNLRDTLLPKLISGELSLEELPNLANQTEPA